MSYHAVLLLAMLSVPAVQVSMREQVEALKNPVPNHHCPQPPHMSRQASRSDTRTKRQSEEECLEWHTMCVSQGTVCAVV